MVTMYSKMLIAALIVAPEVMAMVEQDRFTAWKTQQGKVCASFYFPILNVSPNVQMYIICAPVSCSARAGVR